MKNKIYTVFFLVFTFTICNAQINTDVRPTVKSPEVNKFEQYMNIPVNLVSGTPQVNIPIYTLEYGGMTLPISLEYDASGVKVESIASSVGQNWTLNVGGVVSRIVKGAPDEGNPYAIGAGLWSSIDVDGFYQDYGLSKLESQLNMFSFDPMPYNPNTGINYKATQFERWLGDINRGLKDSEPDLFYFSTPQGGSKFIFNDQRKVVYLENTDFIIKENFLALDNDFKSWDVTSPSGIKYKFGIDNAEGYQGRGNAAESNYTIKNYNEVGGSSNHYIVNSWFLTQIQNHETNQKIELTYIDNNYIQKINSDKSGFTPSCWPTTVSGNGTTGIIYGNSNGGASACAYDTDEAAYNITALPAPQNYVYNDVMSKLISKIKAGNTEVNFIYSARTDLAQSGNYPLPQKLDEIQIMFIDPVTLVAKCVKRFVFNSTTITSPPSANALNPDFDDFSRKRLFLSAITEISCADPNTQKPYVFTYNSTQLPNRMSYAQDKWGYFNGVMTNPSMFPKYGATANQPFANRDIDFTSSKAGSLESITYPTKGTVNFEFEQHQSDVPVDTDNYVRDASIYYVRGLVPYSPTAFSNSFAISNAFMVTDNHILLKMNLIYGTSSFSGPLAGCPTQNTSNAMEIIDSNNVVIYNENYGSLTAQNPMKTIEHYLTDSYGNPLLKVGQTYTVKVYGINGCYHNTTDLVVPKTEIVNVPIYTVGGLRIKKITHKNYDGTIAKQMSYTYIQPKAINRFEKCVKLDYDLFSNIDTFSLTSSDGVPFISELNRNFFKNYIFSRANGVYGNGIQSYSGRFRFITPGKDLYKIDFMGPNITYGQVIETDGNGETKHDFNSYKNHLELHNYETLNAPSAPVFQSILAGEKAKISALNATGTKLKETNYAYNYTTANATVNAAVNVNLGSPADGLTRCYPIYVGQIKTLKTETETTKLNGQDVTTTTDYEYTGVNHFMPTQTTTTNSEGEVLITKTAYPSDVPTEPLMADLIAQNRKIPIKTETFNDITKLSEQHIQFAKDATTKSLVLPKTNYAAKFPNALPVILNIGNLEKKLTYDLYDTNGALLQYTPENGTTTTIIWGYNKTLPIAKIENATYSQVEAISGFGSNFSIATSLTDTQETALRTSLPNAMITTYTHIPLIGVSTITDPKGDRMTYEYDALNRLKWIKDKNGNILSENQYHYKN